MAFHFDDGSPNVDHSISGLHKIAIRSALAEFNAKHPIGMIVRYRSAGGEVCNTMIESPARISENGLPVIALAGIRGYVNPFRIEEAECDWDDHAASALRNPE